MNKLLVTYNYFFTTEYKISRSNIFHFCDSLELNPGKIEHMWGEIEFTSDWTERRKTRKTSKF